MQDYEVPSSLGDLTGRMQEYFDRKHRSTSPSPTRANKLWYSAPPSIDRHNKDIIRVFHRVFRKHVPKTFSLFEGATSAVNTRDQPAYVLSMAALGGVFCTTPGSAEVAKSFYNDARRMLLSSVCLVTFCFAITHASQINTRSNLNEPSVRREDKLILSKTVCLAPCVGEPEC